MPVAQAHDANDAAFWQQPAPPGEDGAVPWVDVRFNLSKVNAVDTVAGTACSQGGAVFYWTDSRLAGWPEGAALPSALWGPRLELDNAMVDLKESVACWNGHMAHAPYCVQPCYHHHKSMGHGGSWRATATARARGGVEKQSPF